MTLTAAEFAELAAAYVLGALDDVTRAACDAHLARPESVESRRLVAELSATADRLADAVGEVAPSPSLWGRIEAQLPAARPRRRVHPAQWALAAAALLALVWLGWSRRQLSTQLDDSVAARAALERTLASQRTVTARCETDLAATRYAEALRERAVTMLSSPSTTLVTLARQPGAADTLLATLVVDLKARRGMVVLQAPAVAGRDYELWVLRGNQKLPAGLLRPQPGAALLAEIDAKLLAGADALAVTVEPTGGTLTPTGPVVLVGPVPKS